MEVLKLCERREHHRGEGEEGKDVGLLAWSPGGRIGQGGRGEGEGFEDSLDPVGSQVVQADGDLKQGKVRCEASDRREGVPI